MNAIEDLTEGVNSYVQAHRFIWKHKLWFYILLPGIINLVIFITTFMVMWTWADTISQSIVAFIDARVFTLSILDWLKSATTLFFSILLKVLFVMGYMAIYKYVVLIIMAPAMALLSERTEEIITGKINAFNLTHFLKDVLRGILISLRNLFIELFLYLILLIISFIPIINIPVPIIMFCISSYYTGFGMMDYYNERKRMTMRQSIALLRYHKWKAIANGAGFYAILAIPIIGWLIAPAYTIVAATLVRHRIQNGLPRIGHS
ncbi:MAG: EI24 domain-containing protein [Bacteroidetes bacterium]|nr:EI24 domain-containing protein [Bacteroidota bacterium]